MGITEKYKDKFGPFDAVMKAVWAGGLGARYDHSKHSIIDPFKVLDSCDFRWVMSARPKDDLK